MPGKRCTHSQTQTASTVSERFASALWTTILSFFPVSIHDDYILFERLTLRSSVSKIIFHVSSNRFFCYAFLVSVLFLPCLSFYIDYIFAFFTWNTWASPSDWLFLFQLEVRRRRNLLFNILILDMVSKVLFIRFFL